MLAVADVVCWAVILAMIGFVLAPTMGDRNTLGSHDWDQMESHRYLVDKTILAYHQFPFWNPYACGGHPNWGGFESGTTVVSPWLPFYLAMTLPHALRVEVWGMALLSAVGAWLLASRFTKSPAVRALVVVAFAVNGRWALQITSGHTWHLAYAWTPWVLYFYDRAVGADASLGPPRRRHVVLAGACLALMVYMGGIYPLPQTVFVVALYGVFLSMTTRSLRPIVVGAACGLLSLGLSAPKLFPILEVLRKHPRLVDSTETIDFSGFVDVLTSREQDMSSGHGGVSQWGWHEWGMYVGWPVVVALVLGVVAGRGTRESALKWAGLVCLSLGFGAFDPHAPWPLLHDLPVFQSQHVPSRWMYPALLLLLAVTASAAERLLRRAAWARGALELLLVAAVSYVAYDVGQIAHQPTRHMFTAKMPAVAESTGPFHVEPHLPRELVYEAEWAPSSLTAEMANVGTIDCGTFPAFHNYFRDQQGHVPGLGAHGVGDKDYRGEAFIPEGVGTATVTRWSPNEVAVEVHGAQPGEHVVLNQNYDPGWSARGHEVDDWLDTVRADLHEPDATVVFRYRPPTFLPGVLVFVVTLGGIGWAYRRARRARAAA
ncbi:MAG TPA: hypothetical protein VHS09_02625 [Polyangiaceae bacterium]|nr:hypothetical protein [Polyangiaceae bacterium]